MTDFGTELRRLLAEGGMSLNEAARRSNYDAGYLSKVASGRKRATPAVAARLDDVLGAGGSLAALADDGPLFNGSLSPDGRERIEHARSYPGRADAAVARSLATVLDAQRHAEDALGSAAIIRPVLAQLAVAEDLVREARGPARPELVHVAGEWASAVAMRAAGIARGTGSARLYRMLRRLRARLAARWPDDARVADLSEALR